MNELKIFAKEEFGRLRTVLIEGRPWFVGNDVTRILGYSNGSKAIADLVDMEDKLNNESLSSLGLNDEWVINESGLYSLILSSKLESAKRFEDWITSEVFPAIRKASRHILQQKPLSDEELIANIELSKLPIKFL